jgi:hypothetical protein
MVGEAVSSRGRKSEAVRGRVEYRALSDMGRQGTVSTSVMRSTALQTYRELQDAAAIMGAGSKGIDQTLERVTALLGDAGIQYAVAGGFAVLAHGYERFTNDVDLLIRAADLQRAMEVLRAAGFHGERTPLGARLADGETGVRVDLLGTAFDADEKALRQAQRTKRLPVIPLPHLVLMKLEAGRSQDEADVVELTKAGAPVAKIRRYLRAKWPALLPRFNRLVERARGEGKQPRRRGPVK